MKRTQIQIAIDALKKQLDKYSAEKQKAIAVIADAQKSVEFFQREEERLVKQIKQLEKPADSETDKVLKALEG